MSTPRLKGALQSMDKGGLAGWAESRRMDHVGAPYAFSRSLGVDSQAGNCQI